jgi:hypothetical protein
MHYTKKKCTMLLSQLRYAIIITISSHFSVGIPYHTDIGLFDGLEILVSLVTPVSTSYTSNSANNTSNDAYPCGKAQT